jgi:hypothetical protein
VEEFLMPILDENDHNDMLFQQDGLPPHFVKEVMNFLNRNFLEKWISTGGLIILSPPFFFLSLIFSFGVHKKMYMSALAITLPELAGRIRAAVATATVNLYNMWPESEYR